MERRYYRTNIFGEWWELWTTKETDKHGRKVVVIYFKTPRYLFKKVTNKKYYKDVKLIKPWQFIDLQDDILHHNYGWSFSRGFKIVKRYKRKRHR